MKHSLVTKPHSKTKLPWYKALNPFVLFFGNNEDGWFGDNRWNPERKTDLKTALKWFMRNPLHNLDFHAIGFSDQHVDIWGTEPTEFTNTSGEGWLFHLIRPVGFSIQRLLLGLLYMIIALNIQSAFLMWIAGLMLNACAPLIPLPFISYTSKTTLVKDFYLGWRPTGAFGIKLQLNVKK